MGQEAARGRQVVGAQGLITKEGEPDFGRAPPLIQDLIDSSMTEYKTGLLREKEGAVLAARMEKGGGVVQVLSLRTGDLVSTIDSHGARLKRPTGLAASKTQGTVCVVDIGHDCVRKYRYK